MFDRFKEPGKVVFKNLKEELNLLFDIPYAGLDRNNVWNRTWTVFRG